MTKQKLETILTQMLQPMVQQLADDLLGDDEYDYRSPEGETREGFRELAEMSVNGARGIVRVKLCPNGDWPKTESYTELFDAVGEGYIDLVLPVQISAMVFED